MPSEICRANQILKCSRCNQSEASRATTGIILRWGHTFWREIWREPHELSSSVRGNTRLERRLGHGSVMLPAPSRSAHSEKLAVSQLFKTLPRPFMDPDGSLLLVPILSQMNPVRKSMSRYFKINFTFSVQNRSVDRGVEVASFGITTNTTWPFLVDTLSIDGSCRPRLN
jgi:hypothetical protein